MGCGNFSIRAGDRPSGVVQMVADRTMWSGPLRLISVGLGLAVLAYATFGIALVGGLHWPAAYALLVLPILLNRRGALQRAVGGRASVGRTPPVQSPGLGYDRPAGVPGCCCSLESGGRTGAAHRTRCSYLSSGTL